MSNLVGLATLALMWSVVSRLMLGSGEWVTPWLILTVISAVIGGGLLFCESPGDKRGLRDEGPGGWLLGALGTVVLGGVFLLVDVIVAWTSGHWDKPPGVSFWDGFQGGGPLGLPLTLIVSPFMTIVSLAGAARSGYQRWTGRR